MKRRAFLKTVAASSALPWALSFSKSAQAAEFEYRIAHSVPTHHPLHVRLVEAADRIREQTNGRFDLRIFPSDQLGSQTDVMSQIRSGAIDFLCLSGVVLSTLVPSSAISGLGFAFKDYDQVWKAQLIRWEDALPSAPRNTTRDRENICAIPGLAQSSHCPSKPITGDGWWAWSAQPFSRHHSSLCPGYAGLRPPA